MAKPAASTSKPPAPASAAKKSQAFEIDDIFASKPKTAPAGGLMTTPNPAPAGAAKHALEAISSLPPTKSKKTKAFDPVEGSEPVARTAAAGEVPGRKAPEVIADPSAAIDSYRVQAQPTLKRKAGDEVDKEAEEEERFMDSRGTISTSRLTSQAVGAARGAVD